MNDDRLRSELDRAAGQVAPGDPAAVLESAHRTVRRRRVVARLTALGAAVTVIAGGAVVALVARGDDSPTVLVGVDPTTTTTTTITTRTPATSVPSSTVPVTVAPEAAPASSVPAASPIAAGGIEVPAPEALEFPQPEIAVPWRDGFLVVGAMSAPTPLPEQLPDEIRELFPPEVLELFPDGLPGTLQEAVDILDEAGLYDVVADIVMDNPEASAAIYSADPLPREYVASFTSDGSSWDEVAFELPDGVSWVESATSDGERLTIVGGSPTSQSTVAWTTDLQNWQVEAIPSELAGLDLPDFVRFMQRPIAFAASEDRWVLRFIEHFHVDPLEIPGFDPATVSGGTSTQFDTSGITVGAADEFGNPVESITVTWAELGVSPEAADVLAAAVERGDHTRILSGSFDGELALAEDDGLRGGFNEPIVTTGAGFVDLADGVRFSSDGVTWEDRTGVDRFVVSAFGYRDGVVVFLSGADGTVAAHRLDARGNDLGPIALEGLPEQFSPYLVGPTGASVEGAALVDAGSSSGGTTTVLPVTFTHEGYVLTLPSGPDDRWTLVDETSGEVVLEGGMDDTAVDDASVVRFGGAGITVVDAATAEPIVTFPHESSNQPTFFSSGPRPPELHIVATLDGETFLVEQLPDVGIEHYGSSLMVNGDRLLVGVNGTWRLFGLR